MAFAYFNALKLPVGFLTSFKLARTARSQMIEGVPTMQTPYIPTEYLAIRLDCFAPPQIRTDHYLTDRRNRLRTRGVAEGE
jgi:hypothetical protein